MILERSNSYISTDNTLLPMSCAYFKFNAEPSVKIESKTVSCDKIHFDIVSFIWLVLFLHFFFDFFSSLARFAKNLVLAVAGIFSKFSGRRKCNANGAAIKITPKHLKIVSFFGAKKRFSIEFDQNTMIVVEGFNSFRSFFKKKLAEIYSK